MPPGTSKKCEACGVRSTKVDCMKTSFFKFPKDEETRKKWLEFAEKKESDIRAQSTLCSAHFSKSASRGIRLKRGTVPTRKYLANDSKQEEKGKIKTAEGNLRLAPKPMVGVFKPTLIIGEISTSVSSQPAAICLPNFPSIQPLPISIGPVSSTSTAQQFPLTVLQPPSLPFNFIGQALSQNSSIIHLPTTISPGTSTAVLSSAKQIVVPSPSSSRLIAPTPKVTVTEFFKTKSPQKIIKSEAISKPGTQHEVITLDDDDADDDVAMENLHPVSLSEMPALPFKTEPEVGEEEDEDVKVKDETVECDVDERFYPIQEDSDDDYIPSKEDLSSHTESSSVSSVGDDDDEEKLCEISEYNKNDMEQQRDSEMDPLSLETCDSTPEGKAQISSSNALPSSAPVVAATLPQIPGLFLVVNNQVYQVGTSSTNTSSSPDKPKDLEASSTNKTDTRTSHQKTFPCPFFEQGVCKVVIKFKGGRLCHHLDTCPGVKKKLEELLLEKELLFLYCPVCNVFNTSLDDKRLLSEHISSCQEKTFLEETAQDEVTRAGGIPLKHRIFDCDSCPQRKYLSLQLFLRHYGEHRRALRRYKCTACDFVVFKVDNAIKHYRLNHATHGDKDDHAVGDIERRWYADTDIPLPAIPWWCPLCHKIFSSEDLRNEHLSSSHPHFIPKLNQKCDMCYKKYFCPDELALHVGTLHYEEKNGLKCDTCSKVFKRASEVRAHRRLEHGKDLLKCRRCKLEFVTIKALLGHTSKTHRTKIKRENRTFPCEKCGKIFRQNRNLKKHFMRVHEKQYSHFCPVEGCGKGLSCATNLYKHLCVVHKTVPYQFPCPVEGCTKKFHAKRVLEDHLSQHRGIKQYKCQYCEKEFYYKAYLQRHEVIHTNAETLPFKCSTCGVGFPRNDMLSLHTKSAHNPTRLRVFARRQRRVGQNDKRRIKMSRKQKDSKSEDALPPFTCNECGKTYNRLLSLRRHIMINHEKKYQTTCEFCGKLFLTKVYLSSHLKNIHGVGKEVEPRPPEPPVVCHLCGKRYTSKYVLARHIETNHEKKNECKCEHCGLVFLRKYYLQIHLANKHGIGTYGQFKCPVKECSKIFYGKALLNHHMTVHNGLGPQFQCDKCEKTFYFPRPLKLHMRSHQKKSLKG